MDVAYAQRCPSFTFMGLLAPSCSAFWRVLANTCHQSLLAQTWPAHSWSGPTRSLLSY